MAAASWPGLSITALSMTKTIGQCGDVCGMGRTDWRMNRQHQRAEQSRHAKAMLTK